MLQEFFINEIEETIENDELYGVMNKRIANCKTYMSIEDKFGLGDICYLVKEVQTKSFLGIAGKKITKIGSYHYVYGLDTSNVAYISAYISKFIQKLNLTNSKVIQSIFCVYDYFTEKDLRILIKFPGGVRKIFYLDEQEAIEANLENLRTVFLSSVLRSWNTRKINNHDLYLEELNNIDSFNYFIDSVHLLIKDIADLKNPILKSKVHLFLEYLLKYLMDTRRFNLAIMNFSLLSRTNYDYLKYAIEPLKILYLYKDALSYLGSVILKTQSSVNSDILNLQIDLLIKLENYQDAIEIAKFITGNNPEVADYWISLAYIYLRKKDYQNCLIVLNNVYLLQDYTNKRNNNIYNNSYENGKQNFSSYEGKGFDDFIIQKNKFHNFQLKFSDILLIQDINIDVYYTNLQINNYETSEIILETIKKIMSCEFYKFDDVQKKIYYIILEIIKDINFESFIEMKTNLFFSNEEKKIKFNGDEIDSSCSSSERIKGLNAILKPSNTDDNKIIINPCLLNVIENLIDDLKIFGVMVSENEEYFNMLYSKENLSISEIKFCISIGVLAERLKYYNTSLNFFTKALKHCYSRFLYFKIIKFYTKLKDYKNAMTTLVLFLSKIQPSQYKYVNRTPRWLDKIILKILYEHHINEIISWISDSPIHVIDYIVKRVVQKYKYWIDVGHELHLIK